MILFLVLLVGILGLPLSGLSDSSEKIFPFLEANAGFFTFLALLVAISPVFSYFINRKKILTLESKPYVQMSFSQNLDRPEVIRLVVGNYGRLPAKNIKIYAPGLQRPGFGQEDKDDENDHLLSATRKADLQKISWLNPEQGISMLPPGKEYSAIFGLTKDIFNKEKLKPWLPEVIPTTIRFEDPNGIAIESKYDLRLTDLLPFSIR